VMWPPHAIRPRTLQNWLGMLDAIEFEFRVNHRQHCLYWQLSPVENQESASVRNERANKCQTSLVRLRKARVCGRRVYMYRKMLPPSHKCHPSPPEVHTNGAQ